MPRPREYATAAARQAAHRARTVAKADELRFALYQLEEALWDASSRGDPLALACRSSSPTTMLSRLTQAFKERPNTSEDPGESLKKGEPL